MFVALLVAVSMTSVGPPTPDPVAATRPASIECVIEAAVEFGVPANVLLGIASVEAGRNGELQCAANVTEHCDLGHFQINQIHWVVNGKRKGRFADHAEITQEAVQWDGCYAARAAAWLVAQELHEHPDLDYWTAVASYHSHTADKNATYRAKLIPLAIRWGDWLQQQYRQQVAVSYQ